jgi:acyl-CoA dehydrogenase
MRIFTDMRAFRIYDGPSEVHRWSMARKLAHMAEKAEAELLRDGGAA